LLHFVKDLKEVRITTSLPIGNLIEGSDLTLTCEVIGNPAPSFSWYHKNKVIKSSAQLTLHELTINDDGDYICKVINHELMLTTNVSLVIEGNLTII